MGVGHHQHGHDHAHGSHGHHGHGHHHAPADFSRAFMIGIALNLGFVAVEAGYGFAANSMALLADAGHNLSDVLGLAVAWAGAALVKRSPSPRFTYGLKKSSILAALVNALLLLVAIGGIGAEAIRRLVEPESSNGQTVMIVAAVGILVNGITAWLFARGGKDDINIRGAYLHMMADAAVSVGVVVAGALILWTGARWIDPVTSLIVAAVILWGTWGLLVESTSMTLAGTPRGIDPELVGRALEKLPGVTGTHHLHIWSLSTTETAMTVHLLVGDEVDRDVILRQANAYVHQMFGIDHSTIQVERASDSDDCAGGHPHARDCGHG
ncbi:cation diffusion facilitator family transporter [Sphingomonas jaspsi]|uniref:cation diffusion facilitator family transporter n=1 Tax=Sphingomonas jaspsi TaxID=392409 RepID=UPI000687BCBD|nr:cation diffusion facilitator family transporter [Sphingomonas jaspsi]